MREKERDKKTFRRNRMEYKVFISADLMNIDKNKCIETFE
jgi:hypothetical protein